MKAFRNQTGLLAIAALFAFQGSFAIAAGGSGGEARGFEIPKGSFVERTGIRPEAVRDAVIERNEAKREEVARNLYKEALKANKIENREIDSISARLEEIRGESTTRKEIVDGAAEVNIILALGAPGKKGAKFAFGPKSLTEILTPDAEKALEVSVANIIESSKTAANEAVLGGKFLKAPQLAWEAYVKQMETELKGRFDDAATLKKKMEQVEEGVCNI